MAWTPTAGVYYHVGLRYDGVRVSALLNAVEYAGLDYAGTIDSTNIGIVIGTGTTTGSTYQLNGVIPSVRVYNRTLTMAEIKRLYESEVMQYAPF